MVNHHALQVITRKNWSCVSQNSQILPVTSSGRSVTSLWSRRARRRGRGAGAASDSPPKSASRERRMIIIDLRSAQGSQSSRQRSSRFARQASAGALPRATNRRDAFGTLALGISNPYFNHINDGRTSCSTACTQLLVHRHGTLGSHIDAAVPTRRTLINATCQSSSHSHTAAMQGPARRSAGSRAAAAPRRNSRDSRSMTTDHRRAVQRLPARAVEAVAHSSAGPVV